jgi:hypothetical protein
VDTGKKRPPVDGQRASRGNIVQGTKVLHDVRAEVSIRLDAGRHKGVTGVQMACMRPVLAPVIQSGIGASRLEAGGNLGRAAEMRHRDIQQGGIMRRGQGHLNLSPRPQGQELCM